MPYTVDDTPAVVARIEADLEAVVQTVRAGDPGLKALLLTGGFARGEGAVMDGAPQNDYDLIAIRGLSRPRAPYDAMRRQLEARLGLHIDLAPVPALRLPWVPPSIFWYETALRGKTVWGPDLTARMPVRRPEDLDRREGLRLLVNRSAGLLLATDMEDAHAIRIQAAKALLAALDSHLFVHGAFPPTQTERWRLYQEGGVPQGPWLADWMAWAYRFKVDPAHAPDRDADAAWNAARRAILEALPEALRHAGLDSLQAYARQDGLLDHLVYPTRRADVPGTHRFLWHPTGRVRVATLDLLATAHDRHLPPAQAKEVLGRLTREVHEPVVQLEGLRRSTLQ